MPTPPSIPNAGDKIKRQINSDWDENMDQWVPSEDPEEGGVPGVNAKSANRKG